MRINFLQHAKNHAKQVTCIIYHHLVPMGQYIDQHPFPILPLIRQQWGHATLTSLSARKTWRKHRIYLQVKTHFGNSKTIIWEKSIFLSKCHCCSFLAKIITVKISNSLSHIFQSFPNPNCECHNVQPFKLIVSPDFLFSKYILLYTFIAFSEFNIFYWPLLMINEDIALTYHCLDFSILQPPKKQLTFNF